MLSPGPAQRVILHLNEDAASEGDYLYLEILSFLFCVGVAGTTVLRGHAGFGVHHRLHIEGAPGTDGQHLPIRIEFVESLSTVEAIMPRLIAFVTDGLIEVQPTTIVHIAQATKTPHRTAPDADPAAGQQAGNHRDDIQGEDIHREDKRG